MGLRNHNARRIAWCRLALAALGCAIAQSFVAASLAAQLTNPQLDDATVLRRGVLRVGLGGMWETYRDRFGEGTPGRSKGAAEPLGIDFSVDSLGARQITGIAPLVAPLRALSELSSVDLSLGSLRVRMDASIITTPVTADLGVTRRLTFGVRVPYVTTRNEISLQPNPGGTSGNIGLNPALSFAGARSANTALVNELSKATSDLQGLITLCQANPAQPRCAAVNADLAGAQSLIGRTGAVVGGISNVYGTGQVAGGRFAPVAGSALQLAIEQRLAALNTSFRGFLALAAGDPNPISRKPTPAAPLALGDFRLLMQDPLFRIEAATLDSAATTSVGDIEVGAKFLLVDNTGADNATQTPRPGLRMRASVGAAYRFGTGTVDVPDDFGDIGTGDGQDDIEARGFVDLMWGRRFWMSIVGRYGVQMADELERRITRSPDEPFPPIFRRQVVARDLGDYFSLEVAPRITIGSYLAFAAVYRYRNKQLDTYSGSLAVDPEDVAPGALDAATLGLETAQTEQRVGGALTYSTLGAYYRGETTIPVDLVLVTTQALSGTGNTPRSSITQIQLRYHMRLFGAEGRRPALRR